MTRSPAPHPRVDDGVHERPSTIHPIVLGAVLLTTVAACAASRDSAAKSPEAAAPAAEATPAQQPGGYPAPSGYPYATAPAPPPPPPSTQPAQPQPGQPETSALKASRDFDQAERELAVATSDCTNACRALGSMDRAAGNICKLSTDKPRCDDATTKVRSAREKVKNSCGDCKETSTNRNDPVPSR